jgi:hypothetical protein
VEVEVEVKVECRGVEWMDVCRVGSGSGANRTKVGAWGAKIDEWLPSQIQS